MFSFRQRTKRLKHYLFHRGGHGVHSHFAYRLIRDVIEEKLPYYSFLALRSRIRQEDLAPNKYDGLCKSKHLELIFRLCLFTKCQKAVLLGPTESLVGKYIEASSPETQLYNTIESELPVASQENTEQRLSTLIIVESPRMLAALERLLSLSPPREFTTILIQKNWKAKTEVETWQRIKKNWVATMCIDLAELELLFYSSKLNKKAYKAFI